MKYLGGKARIAKQIGSFLNKFIEDNKIEKYIEPFCGACWITQEITPKVIRIASDVHVDLILLWQALKEGWIPPENITEDEYRNLKNAESSALRGFVGFGSSFSGKWYGGFARCRTSDRNYTKEAKNTLLKKMSRMKDVYFKNCSYLDLPIEKMSKRLIYCDCPYQGTTKYSGIPPFNHDVFWDWCRKASKENYVFISEYKAPEDFRAELEIVTKTDMSNKEGKKEQRIEKLFKYIGDSDRIGQNL